MMSAKQRATTGLRISLPAAAALSAGTRGLRLAPGATVLATLALAAGLAACVKEQRSPLPGNLLANAKAETGGIANLPRATDGLAANEGDFWDTGVTARFESPTASATWDLGSSQKLAAVLVQADNNDVYIFSISQDGKTFAPLWQAPPADGAGMRLRQSTVNGTARYVRLTATGGDGLFSVGEVAVFAATPQGWPGINLPRAEAAAPEAGAAGWGVSIGVLVAAIVILLLLSRRKPARPAPAAPAAPSTPSESDLPPPAP